MIIEKKEKVNFHMHIVYVYLPDQVAKQERKERHL